MAKRNPAEGNPFAGISCLTCGSTTPEDRPPERPTLSASALLAIDFATSKALDSASHLGKLEVQLHRDHPHRAAVAELHDRAATLARDVERMQGVLRGR